MKSGSHHDICALKALENAVKVGRVVLPISIHLCDRSVAMALAVEEGGSHSSTYTHVKGKGDHRCSGLAGKGCRCVLGAIIDNQDVHIRTVFSDLLDHVGDGRLLIPRGDSNECGLRRHVLTLADAPFRNVKHEVSPPWNGLPVDFSREVTDSTGFSP